MKKEGNDGEKKKIKEYYGKLKGKIRTFRT